jgi:hypothetical protein
MKTSAKHPVDLMKAIIAVILTTTAAYADLIPLSDNRSTHITGHVFSVGNFDEPFDVLATPSAPFAPFNSSTSSGPIHFGLASSLQNSTITPRGFSLVTDDDAAFMPAGPGTVGATYQIVNTFDISFQILAPEAFELSLIGAATRSFPTIGSAIANFEKDGSVFRGVLNQQLFSGSPIILDGVLDPGIYHINVATSIEGVAGAGDNLNAFAVMDFDFKLVPDTGNSAMLLLGSLVLLPVSSLRGASRRRS